MAVEFVSPRGTPPRPGPGAATPSLFDHAGLPSGYRGPVVLSGTGRTVWWTGRIAIGLRYAPGRTN